MNAQYIFTNQSKEKQLNTPDENTFYAQGAKGYTDYPTLKG